jgi:hypothetical protein
MLLPFYGCYAQNKKETKTENGMVKIDTLLTPEIGGIKQVIEIKTEDSNRPVLLFLSGGPGSSMMKNAGSFTNILKIDSPLFNGIKEMREKHWN